MTMEGHLIRRESSFLFQGKTVYDLVARNDGNRKFSCCSFHQRLVPKWRRHGDQAEARRKQWNLWIDSTESGMDLEFANLQQTGEALDKGEKGRDECLNTSNP